MDDSIRWKRTRWAAFSDADWTAARNALIPYAYPATGVIPTALADAVVRNSSVISPLPAGCAHVDEYTIASPGNRSGGTPEYTQLLYPTATPVGKLLVSMSGALATSWWNDAGTMLIVGAALAAGWHVLGCHMCGFGTNPYPFSVVWNGSLHTYNNSRTYDIPQVNWDLNHATDGGSPAAAMYVHYAILSLTQAIADVSPSRISIMGHSSGATLCPVIATMDPRYTDVVMLQGPRPCCAYQSSIGVSEPWNTFAWGDNGAMAYLAGSFPGRRLFCSDHMTQPGQILDCWPYLWPVEVDYYNRFAYLRNREVVCYAKMGGDHFIDQPQASAVTAFLGM